MRNNQPVTDNEVRFSSDVHLITTTDLQGVITFANDDFVKVSGFERQELIGQHHNVIRHPDMPKEAFADLWKTIRSGRSWSGMVKNRCKNGDFYWVNAYVTPILNQNGQVIEYQSVRTLPSAEAKARAEQQYKRWREGASTKGSRSPRLAWKLTCIAALPGLLVALTGAIRGDYLLVPISAVLAIFCSSLTWLCLGSFRRLAADCQKMISHPTISYLFTGRTDELGSIQYVRSFNISETRAIIARLENTCHYIKRAKIRADSCVEEANDAILSQGQHVEEISGAMARLLDSQQHVAVASNRTSEASEQSRLATTQGRDQLEQMVGAILRRLPRQMLLSAGALAVQV
ncbi:PAS domain-containing protein [Chromatiaceae bacterium AAb-1]|nr:PAS domain-containing protein [Chromatiaceae bacterium AAb-1]